MSERECVRGRGGMGGHLVTEVAERDSVCVGGSVCVWEGWGMANGHLVTEVAESLCCFTMSHHHTYYVTSYTMSHHHTYYVTSHLVAEVAESLCCFHL